MVSIGRIIVGMKYEKVALRSTTVIADAPSHQDRLGPCPSCQAARGARQAIVTIPEFLWELSLGIWLTVRGFNPSVIASEKFRPMLAQP